MRIQSRWLAAVSRCVCVAGEAVALLTFICLWLVMPTAALAQIVLTDLVPASGTVRTEVVLSGSGFATGGNTSITVNGKTAAIIDITPTTMTFVISPGTSSGPVVLTVDGMDFIHPQPFTVTRMVSGTLQLPSGVNPAGYNIGSSAEFVDPAPGSGTFRIAVPRGRPTLLMAFRKTNDPVFMAVVTGALQQVTIDATSTAIALAFLSPAIATRVESAARQRLAVVAGLSEVATLAERITSLSRNGRNYLDDARVTAALLSVLQAAAASLAGAPVSITADFKQDPEAPADVLLKDLHPGGARGLRLETKVLKNDAQHPDHYRLQFESAGVQNPLDWIIGLYRLDPRQFPGGQFDVDKLSALHKILSRGLPA